MSLFSAVNMAWRDLNLFDVLCSPYAVHEPVILNGAGMLDDSCFGREMQ